MADAASSLILIVEDEPLIRLVAASSLEDAGFDVLQAENAEEALAILRSRKDVALLFTDIQMPGSFDGLDLAAIVHHHWPAIKILVTSSAALRHAVPDDGRFVKKPYTLALMTETVSSIVSSQS